MARLRGSKNKKKKQFCKYGHDTFITGRYANNCCKKCTTESSQKYNLEHSKEVKIRNEMYRRKYKVAIAKYKKKYKLKNKEKVKKYHQKYNCDHKEQIKKWQREHPEIVALNNLKNQTNRNLRIPKFGQKGIRKFYKNRPKGMVVDHIIPLQGKLVSGLHVIWNLQYLTVGENIIKHNKFDGTKENISWKNNFKKSDENSYK